MAKDDRIKTVPGTARTLNPCIGSSNLSAPASVLDTPTLEVVELVQPEIVTPGAWLFAPEWLTPLQAAWLSGQSEGFIAWLVEEGNVETNTGGLIDKFSLHRYLETLVEMLHWQD